MKTISSTELEENFESISDLVNKTGEPICITLNGEPDLMIMSIAAYECQKNTLGCLFELLDDEFSRITKQPTYTTEQVREMLNEKFADIEIQE